MSLSTSASLLLLLLVWCGLRGEASELDLLVRVEPGRVEIRARRVPLERVLDAVAAAQGFRVSYDGPPPQQLVSTTMFATETEEALRVLLSRTRTRYALALHPGTRRLRSLIVVASTGTPPRSRPTPTPEGSMEPAEPTEIPPPDYPPSPPDR